MTDHVKSLPDAAIPPGGLRTWSVSDAERWRAAATPAAFSPVAGSWALAPLVAVAAVLLGWNDAATADRGTGWAGYPVVFLLISLPLWFRLTPVAALAATALLAGYSAFTLAGLPAGDTAGLGGCLLVFAVCAYVCAGATLRLRARRRQRSLALAAAGPGRHPLPRRLPESHRLRGLGLMLPGGVLCVGGVIILCWALAMDLGARRAGTYDATGQQILALLSAVPGAAMLGRGVAAQLAARRLRAAPQPALLVGVRATGPAHNWLYADARTPTAQPLICFRSRFEDRVSPVRTLQGGSAERLRAEHQDVNPFSEPFEAILYGAPREGAEVVLEYAVVHDGTLIVTEVAAVPLLARLRRQHAEWGASGTSSPSALWQRKKDADRRRRSVASTGSSGSSCGSFYGCGSDSSCGGGCGGGD
ncbi:hypothetical protein [Streptomyces sp. NPDC060031]|uniref:hypothetical protein n=1 Tax=Streptomyces sp. NPDC060031 TaxID=3347043 RepID=UPI00367B5BF2